MLGQRLLRGWGVRNAAVHGELRQQRGVLRRRLLRRRPAVLRRQERAHLQRGRPTRNLPCAVSTLGSTARAAVVPLEELDRQQACNFRSGRRRDYRARLAKILLTELANSFEISA